MNASLAHRAAAAGKRALLVVSPRFVPSDAVDIHRVRMNAPYYPANGWQPSILAVEPTAAGRLVDEALSRTVPQGIAVTRIDALPEWTTRVFGVSDLALRAFARLEKAGDELIRRNGVNLVFFSTTSFLTMQLGARWKLRHGVPFVLDFQDPWSAAPPTTLIHRRKGLKHRLMQRLHARAEARTVPHASGLIAVSEPYIAALRAAYPALRSVPAETIPFGYAPSDFSAAKAHGTPWRPFVDAGSTTPPVALYAGRIAAAMRGMLSALLTALRVAEKRGGTGPLATLHLAFLGTGYQRAGNPVEVVPVAAAAGIAKRVREAPDRVPLLDALASLTVADVLLLLGSDDLAYQPSKLYQLMATRRPILVVAPAASRIAAAVRPFRSLVLLAGEDAVDPAAVAAADKKLASLLAASNDDPVFAEREAVAETFSARTLAKRECALFNRAFAHYQESFTS